MNNAEDTLQKGLSPGARYALGGAGALFGIYSFVVMGDTRAPVFMAGFGTFCLVIAVACFTTGAARAIACRVIGGVIFAAALLYVLSELFDSGAPAPGPARSSIFHALGFMVVFGVPGLAYAILGRFPGQAEAQPAKPGAGRFPPKPPFKR